MCELFGASLKNKEDLRDYLKQFYSHSNKHPHGWGIMRFNGGKREIYKEPVRATGSRNLSAIVSETAPQTDLLAHIRLATVGIPKQENCHPFSDKDASGREWTLIHNGTIYSSRTLMKYLNNQEGDTDSERVFLYLIEKINEKSKDRELSAEERFLVVEQLVAELSRRNKLNLMIFDGELLYVHKNMNNTLSFRKSDNGYLFSTQPLGDDWEDYPMCRLCAFRNGELVFEGKEQTSEFVPTLEYISAMAAMGI